MVYEGCILNCNLQFFGKNLAISIFFVYIVYVTNKETTMNTLNELLKTLFTYDAETGEIRHAHKPRGLFESDKSWKTANTRCYGKIATVSQSNGGLVVNVPSVNGYVRANRVALAHMGINESLVSTVKTKDGDPSNLAWDNLVIHKKGAGNGFDAYADINVTKNTDGTYRIGISGAISAEDEIDAQIIKARLCKLLGLPND